MNRQEGGQTMKRDIIIGYALLVMGFALIVVMLLSLSARAADQPIEKAIGPAMESGKDLSDRDLSMPRIDPKTVELTKEMEKPMRVPDTSQETKSQTIGLFAGRPRTPPTPCIAPKAMTTLHSSLEQDWTLTL
jgi:hypothetical protein